MCVCADEKHFAWTAAPKLRNRAEEVPGGEGKETSAQS